ncbi:MAG: ribosome biogenesis GTPase Der [Chloroflexota bacterium]
MSEQKPIVALVGRPNVGKSTLFNLLVGHRKAIVEELAGTTRDRLYGDSFWNGRDFIVIDTGGIEIGAFEDSRSKERIQRERAQALGFTAGATSGLFRKEIRQQADLAIDEADVILFLVDVETGITSADGDIANMLRRTSKPVFLVVNKVDSDKREEDVYEFYNLGLGDPISISAINSSGSGDLLDAVVESFPEADSIDEEDESVKIAILGRPNMGKSSLLNKLLGEDRVIVSDVPGTTRDAIDMKIMIDDLEVTLIDTAGIRRRGKIEPGVEKYSFLRAIKAISRADVCLLLIDSTEGVAAQDAHIAGYIIDEYKSLVLLVNKWDLVEKDTYTMLEQTKLIRNELKFLDYVPLKFISALTGQRVSEVLSTAIHVDEERHRRVPTSDLNNLLQEAIAKHPPYGMKGRTLKFYYVTQAAVSPPTFIFFVNNHKLVHFGYKRYLENALREHYEFLGTPLKIIFRSRGSD